MVCALPPTDRGAVINALPQEERAAVEQQLSRERAAVICDGGFVLFCSCIWLVAGVFAAPTFRACGVLAAFLDDAFLDACAESARCFCVAFGSGGRHGRRLRSGWRRWGDWVSFALSFCLWLVEL